MASVNLVVELESPKEPLLPGEMENKVVAYVGGTLSGTVRVKSEKDIDCRGLRVELSWHTRGKGGKESKTVARDSKDLMRILPEQETAVPFSLKVPKKGPISYQGKILSIIWTLNAIVDIPGRRDINAEEVITVLPALL